MACKKSALVIVCLSVALALSLLTQLKSWLMPEAEWLVKPDDSYRTEQWEALAVSSGLFSYAQNNSGRLPDSLDRLKPDYVGASVDLSSYYLARPGATQWWKFEEIVSKKIQTPEGEKIVCIFGNGQVSVSTPGD